MTTAGYGPSSAPPPSAERRFPWYVPTGPPTAGYAQKEAPATSGYAQKQAPPSTAGYEEGQLGDDDILAFLDGLGPMEGDETAHDLPLILEDSM